MEVTDEGIITAEQQQEKKSKKKRRHADKEPTEVDREAELIAEINALKDKIDDLENNRRAEKSEEQHVRGLTLTKNFISALEAEIAKHVPYITKNTGKQVNFRKGIVAICQNALKQAKTDSTYGLTDTYDAARNLYEEAEKKKKKKVDEEAAKLSAAVSNEEQTQMEVELA